jgi:hypothetical protein
MFYEAEFASSGDVLIFETDDGGYLKRYNYRDKECKMTEKVELKSWLNGNSLIVRKKLEKVI